MKTGMSFQQVQKQLLAPAMRQSIEMLLLPLTELTLSIDQELQNNPLLEIDEEKEDQSRSELLRMLDHAGQTRQIPLSDYSADDETLEDRPISIETKLEDQLLRQLHIEISDPLEIKIGELIIGSLNEDGYLTISLEEIAQNAETDDLRRVEYVLKIIQNFEPVGIASRSLKECLLAQVTLRCNGKSETVYKMIDQHLVELGGKKFQNIAKKMNLSIEAVKEAARLIALFEPKPARNYRPIKTNLYIKPDIFILKDDESGYHVHINKDGIPPLRVNTRYQKMLEKKNLTAEERNFIREKLKNALHFIKSIEQRGQTIRRIAEYILDKQKDFFEKGSQSLVPMTLKDIALAIERNESTISRAINDKYMDTPQGLFPLKFFFSQGISDNRITGMAASRSIKEEIKELFNGEDTSSPLSDQDVQDYFKKKGVTIARRTVSKYRQGLKILPSHLRKT
jgi:RNA polymerase sigma-54 factor